MASALKSPVFASAQQASASASLVSAWAQQAFASWVSCRPLRACFFHLYQIAVASKSPPSLCRVRYRPTSANFAGKAEGAGIACSQRPPTQSASCVNSIALCVRARIGRMTDSYLGQMSRLSTVHAGKTRRGRHRGPAPGPVPAQAPSERPRPGRFTVLSDMH